MQKFLIIVLVILTTNTASAQSNKISGLPIRLGDSIEKVKAEIGTDIEPEEVQETTSRFATSTQKEKKQQLRLKTKGIWVFFDKSGRVYTIRLEAPFAGNVDGVEIGKSRAFLVEKMGKPVKILKQPFAFNEPYIYYTDDITTVRFAFDNDDVIDVIYIEK